MEVGKAATTIQEERLHELMYDKKYFVGRDKLWDVYRKTYSDKPVSQRTTNAWLQKQTIHQTFQRPLPRGIIKPILNSTPGYMSLDCFQFPSYNGFSIGYNMVDTFTKRYWCLAYKEQTAQNTINFIKEVRRTTPGVKISVIQADQGSEYKEPFASWLKDEGITLIHSKIHSPWSNMIERYGGTCKRMLSQALQATGSSDWVTLLPTIVKNMNTTVSFATKETPLNVDQSSDKLLHKKVFTRIANKAAKSYDVKARGGDDIKLGDFVRKVFDYEGTKIVKPSKRGYFAAQVYEIIEIVPSKYANAMPSFKLRNVDSKEIMKGQWARWQLILVPAGSYTPDAANNPNRPDADDEGKYEIQSIVASRVDRKGKKFYKVKWLGWASKYNTWQAEEELLEDAPEIVEEYENANR